MTEWNEILTPEYDSTWPFNFKWAWNHETDETDVWKVQGGTDGRPAHRAETEKRWGRPSNVGAGDVLGVAAYIPSERKLDGTVVAPGEVQLQAYYEKPIPDGVRLWFAQAYPEATIRAATIVHPRLGRKTTEFAEKKRTGMLKWVWNKRDGTLIWEPNDDNLPTHTDKTTAEWGRSLQLGSGGFDSHASPDFIGYAYPEPGKVEIDAYSSCPPAAIAAVKTQLAEWFPHDQIISGADSVEQHEFSGDPSDYRAASLAWVEEHLEKVSEDHGNRLQISLEPSNTKSGLLGRFLPKWALRRVADADMDGAMVALFLSEAHAKKLRPRGGEPIENMHITLLYFNEKASERSDWDEVKKIVEQVANQTAPLSGKVSGYGVFNTPDGDALWASPSIQGLAELRHKLYEACEDAGFHVNTEHDWVPHITLKYKHKGKLPSDKGVELEFKELSFAQGEDHHDFELTGNFEKKTVRRLAAQRLGFIKIAPNIDDLAQRARDNLLNREDLVAMNTPWIDPTGKLTSGTEAVAQIGHTPTTDEILQLGYQQNPKYNPEFFRTILRTLNGLPSELFKFYPWVVKQWKNSVQPTFPGGGGFREPWGNPNHLRDILTQAFQHMEYLRSQPPGSPNAAPVPDINQLDFTALEQWVYQRSATGIDVRPGTQWEYEAGAPTYGASSGTSGEYPHEPQKKQWDVGDGWSVWPVWSKNDLAQEGNLMGHCVGGYSQNVHNGETAIFSVRDPKGEPHVTIELEPKGDGSFKVIQVQGKSNQEPADEYKEKVRHFFSDLQAEGHPLTQDITIETSSDLENAEYITPAWDYGIEPHWYIDHDSIARELVGFAEDGYGIHSEEAAIDDLEERGVDVSTLRTSIGEEAEYRLEDKASEMEREWIAKKNRLRNDFIYDWKTQREEERWAEAKDDEDENEEEEDDDAEPDDGAFEEWLEQHYPGEYEGEYYGWRYKAEEELGGVADLASRFGSVQRTAANDYLDWSGWEGAHRFITDGKELLTDPETGRIDESQWRDPELEAKFRAIYPDAKSFVSGWTIPTADGMGVGVYAPAAGHGDKHEPGLHEIIQVVEKELGKPAHLITNHGHISDDHMYAPGEVSEWQTL